MAAARQALGLTNEELARQVGVTLRTVQRWQLGEGTPAGVQLVRLASVLQIEDPSELYLKVAA